MSHTDPLFKKHKILKIADLYSVQGIKLYCLSMDGNCPTYIKSAFETNMNIHGYNTRQSQNIHKPHIIGKIQEQTIQNKLVQTWNVIPETIKIHYNSMSIVRFTKLVKNYLLDLYPQYCMKEDCYSCLKTAQNQ